MPLKTMLANTAMTSPHESHPDLSPKEAIELLQIHSFTYHDVHDPRMENGFLGSLRPYQGTLNHDAFLELMACIKTLGPNLSRGESVDRQIISNLWGICQLARAWAIYPEGMLRSNKLINDADVKTMDDWLDCISYAVMIFLETSDVTEALAPYNQYVEDHGKNT